MKTTKRASSGYREPSDYIPREIRKQCKIGEFAPKKKTAKKSGK